MLSSKFSATQLNKILKIAQSFSSLAKLGPPHDWEAAVHLVGKKKMIVLNSHYRKKAYPTDILSFPAPSPFRDHGFIGELVICLPTLKEQAVQQKHTEKDELNILLVHGVLHLLGLDHERSPDEAKKMARWESRILAQISRRGPKGLIHRAK